MDEELVKGITAMVVDDDRDCAGAMAKFLELHGAVVETADRGAEALLILREREFDVVLTDIALPQVDGFALLKAIRADEEQAGRGHHVRVIAVSGYAREADRKKVAEAGFELMLTKPVDPRELVLAVRSC